MELEPGATLFVALLTREFDAVREPSDDAREVLEKAIRFSLRFDMQWSPDEARSLASVLVEPVYRRLAELNRTVQGEPSDAAVKAACQAYEGELVVGSGDGDDAMRAALIAAAAVQGGETR